MKNIILTVSLILFGINIIQAQGYDEYKYWGVKVGITHNFLDGQPAADFNNLMLESPIGTIQLKPVESHQSYTPGLQAGLVLNKDMKNDKMGIIANLNVSNYGVSGHYETPLNPNYNADIDYNVWAAQGGVMFKIGGKELYEQMRYLYFGGKVSYNLSLYKAERVNWTSDVTYVKEPSEMVTKYNVIGTAGINYMFFFAEVNFVPGGFFQDSYQTVLPDGNIAEPFAGQVKNVTYFSTGINVPLNSWTSRKVYDIETFIKRLF